MAKMIGAKVWLKRCPYMCCAAKIPRSSIKAQEKQEWIHEAETDLSDFPHENGLCSDPKTGVSGCGGCYGEDFDYYDASELDGIKGVWTDTARLLY